MTGESKRGGPGLHGLRSATNCSFTASPDARVITILYDALSVSWNNGSPDPVRMPEARFVLALDSQGAELALQLDLRGFASPACGARIRLTIGGDAQEILLDEETYCVSASAHLAADLEVAAVSLLLDLPQPSDGQPAVFALDSIDISCSAHPEPSAAP